MMSTNLSTNSTCEYLTWKIWVWLLGNSLKLLAAMYHCMQRDGMNWIDIFVLLWAEGLYERDFLWEVFFSSLFWCDKIFVFRAIEMYTKRIKWLLQGSKRVSTGHYSFTTLITSSCCSPLTVTFNSLRLSSDCLVTQGSSIAVLSFYRFPSL